jgi:hypothetical protein
VRKLLNDTSERVSVWLSTVEVSNANRPKLLAWLDYLISGDLYSSVVDLTETMDDLANKEWPFIGSIRIVVILAVCSHISWGFCLKIAWQLMMYVYRALTLTPTIKIRADQGENHKRQSTCKGKGMRVLWREGRE